jgi:hypothetical protein
MGDVHLIKNSDGSWIDPAEAGLQEELIREVKKLESATFDVKFQALTLGVGLVGTPASHGCKRVKFWTALSDCYVGDADSQPVLLVASIWNDLSINNVGNLRFVSASGGPVYLISSN